MKILMPLISVIIFMTGCLGRAPHPVMATQENDAGKSCQMLNNEITRIDQELQQKYLTLKNAEKMDQAVGILGAIFSPLSIFKDYRKADLVEYNAIKKRYNHLVGMEQKTGCGFEHSMKPVLEPCSDFFTLDCLW